MKQPAAGREESLRPVRLFLVDDHDEARSALTVRLQAQHGLEVVGAASDVHEARTLLPDAAADMVLLDVHGDEAARIAGCRALRRMTDTPIVMFASYITAGLWGAAHNAGASAYLLKNIDTRALGDELLRLAQVIQPVAEATPQGARRS